MDPYVGEIRLFGGNFAPRGWALCDGQLLSIASNQALFSLIGTTYGGDGRTTFALPDLRGRIPLHQGPGFAMGQRAGSESVTLTTAQIPGHAHTLVGTSTAADTSSPAGAVLAQSNQRYAAAGAATTTMNPSAAGSTGGSQPHPNMQPYTCVSFIIALEGLFPPRN